MLPNAFVKVDAFCPKCGSPLTAKLFMGKTYIVCSNPLCDYYRELKPVKPERK